MRLSLSTSWNAHRYTNGFDLIKEIEETGFKNLELSFNLTKNIVEDLGSLIKEKNIGITSVHNYCPIPNNLKREKALPDCYSLASINEDERKLAIHYTKNTILTAKSFGAKVVVLHCGRVEIKDRFPELISLYNQGLKNSPEYIALQKRMISERQALIKKHFAKALLSLEELAEFAKKNEINIGIETRYYHREIPSFKEIGIILDTFKENIFYWHDTGHAEVHERLGFEKHKQFLDAYSERLIGVHLHDIRDTDDHLAPGQGSFDFSIIKPYLRENTLKIIEAHTPATILEIIRAKELLEKIL